MRSLYYIAIASVLMLSSCSIGVDIEPTPLPEDEETSTTTSSVKNYLEFEQVVANNDAENLIND